MSCSNFEKKVRVPSLAVRVGDLAIGGSAPVVIQSMTNTDTNDVAATVAQTKRLVEAGAQMVRITVPSMKEVEALRQIKSQLRREHINVPLIADVHFNPKVAEAVATFVEKVRINPGNFVDKRNFNYLNISDLEYQEAIEKMAERAKPLLQICKEHGTAIRVGTNHGSLSDRIVSRYGNTPHAMAMSAAEWIDICEHWGFHDLIFSMKSSNVNTMMSATCAFAALMSARGRRYPLHLGVTEAGNGVEARAKSAAGIGALLLNGIGETIRVSLTEAPEHEIHFARRFLEVIDNLQSADYQIDSARRMVVRSAQPDHEKCLIEVAALVGYEHFKAKISDLVVVNAHFSEAENSALAALILQACRIKMSRAEFISCPSCGRTQYDIESVLAQVKQRFSDPKYAGLKIGVMGCIVNGPGEMADADFGVVGTANGKLVVYRGKERLSAPLDFEEAMNFLQLRVKSAGL